MADPCAAASLSPAQRRMLEVLEALSRREQEKHHDGGWIEAWDIFDAWGPHIPFGLLCSTSSRTFRALDRAGLVEEHPDHRDLIRPAGFGARSL